MAVPKTANIKIYYDWGCTHRIALTMDLFSMHFCVSISLSRTVYLFEWFGSGSCIERMFVYSKHVDCNSKYMNYGSMKYGLVLPFSSCFGLRNVWCEVIEYYNIWWRCRKLNLFLMCNFDSNEFSIEWNNEVGCKSNVIQVIYLRIN